MVLDFDVAIVGAGAAGMMCAATAGHRGKRVVLIDHASRLGEKIRISGGGRCNFTNIHCRAEDFRSENPAFCRSALARYTPRHFVAMVERHGISYHEKKLGQLFCDGSSTQIIEMLRSECDAGGVAWRMPCEVTSLAREGAGFVVDSGAGRLRVGKLVIATGGLSIPKIGASPFGYRVARAFGLSVVPPRPGLVPLVFDSDEHVQFSDLSGVAADAIVSSGLGQFRENLLFTHRGLSGPAILQVSSYWEPGEFLAVNLLPDHSGQDLLLGARRSSALPATVLSEYMPRRIAQRWCELAGLDMAMNQIADHRLRHLGSLLNGWRIRPSGTAGYQKAEVTLGGVDTRELSSRTMEAVKVPGLYFVGEVVDVTGHLGGFNFQWAWSSGHAAGEAV